MPSARISAREVAADEAAAIDQIGSSAMRNSRISARMPTQSKTRCQRLCLWCSRSVASVSAELAASVGDR
jgi:hypothetical protein